MQNLSGRNLSGNLSGHRIYQATHNNVEFIMPPIITTWIEFYPRYYGWPNKLFSIYAVETIDQALELLMQTTAGEINSTGRYPRKSIHGLALDKLSHFAQLLEGEEE